MPKILIISDLHLGSPVAKTDKILQVLEIPCDKLIINGDLFDSMNLKRFNSEHWKILSKIRKLSKKIPITFCKGNHDCHIENLAALLGVEFVHDCILSEHGKTIYICHGDRFDSWSTKQFISDFFTGLYYLVQRMDGRERKISTWLKLKSKQVLKVHKHMEERAIRYAKHNFFDCIICSHSHLEGQIERDGIQYFNTGSFCENPCSYIEINDKEILLKEI